MATSLGDKLLEDETLSDNEHIWKKKPSIGKFVEDIRKVWKYSLIYVNMILG